MESIDYSTIQLSELILRLNDQDQHVCILDRHTTDGWEPMLAWNPVDSLTVVNIELSPTQRIENFVDSQQQAGRIVVGYASYDLGAFVHGVRLDARLDVDTPLAVLYSFDSWITFGQDRSIVHSDSAWFKDNIAEIMGRSPRRPSNDLYERPLSPVWSRAMYTNAYQKIKSYITEGDVYQVNLTHRLQGTTNKQGLDVYSRLAVASKANYRAYIAGSNSEIISLSPERFVSIKNGVIETMPIKGTRPRGTTAQLDQLIQDDLRTNSKDMAELNMITDLMRNDIGEICSVGSVRVVEERVLTAYPTLWHAHSNVQGHLAEDISPIKALLTLLPGGSITGCPKKRAIEIIDEIEETRRGVYTGSVFVVYPNGDLDSNIAIRTMIKKDNELHVSVGGGIVYASDEQNEYNESLQKAAVFTPHD